MPRRIVEHEMERSSRHIVIALDPHDGDCHGDHDIIVEATKFPSFEGRGFLTHVTYTWKTSVVLSQNGTEEFRNGLTKALERGEELKKELDDAP